MTMNTKPWRKPLGRARTPQEIADDIEVTVEGGARVAHIRTPGGRIVKMDAADFERLLDDGWSPALRLACPGGAAVYVVARKLKARLNKAGGPPKAGGPTLKAKPSDAIVARLVTGAADDEAVRYLNGRYDLRRRSLVVEKSPPMAARVAARSKVGREAMDAGPTAKSAEKEGDRNTPAPAATVSGFVTTIPQCQYDDYGFPVE